MTEKSTIQVGREHVEYVPRPQEVRTTEDDAALVTFRAEHAVLARAGWTPPPPGALRKCPECGDELARTPEGRVVCLNYGGCELAAG
jgi:hypothetical protein